MSHNSQDKFKLQPAQNSQNHKPIKIKETNKKQIKFENQMNILNQTKLIRFISATQSNYLEIQNNKIWEYDNHSVQSQFKPAQSKSG